MKKLLFTCLIGMFSALTIRAEITIRIDADSRGLEMTRDDTGFGHLRAEGFHLVTEAGAPELPYIEKTYYLPYNAVKAELIIREGERMPVHRDFTPFPSQGLIRVGAEEDETTFIPLSKEYETGIYPKEAAQIACEDIIMEQNLVTIALYPYVYDADDKILYQRSLDVTITYQTDTEKDGLKVIPSYNRRETARELVKSLVENPQDVRMFEDDRETSARRIQPLRTGGDGTSMPDFIIITCDSLVEAFQPLAEWKNRKGIPTIIETTEYIGSHYEGVDLCEKIRNYIKEKETQWGVSLSILLGGDASIIPSRSYDGSEFREVTDVYYVNRKYWPPTIERPSAVGLQINSLIGRFPINNLEETTIIIDKNIRYEQANENIDYSYINNNLIAAAYLRKNTNSGSMYNLYYYTKNISKNFWYQFDFFSSQWSHVITGEELTKLNFLNALRIGANNWGPFHIVWHEDHSERFAMGTSASWKNSYVTNYDIDSIAFQDCYYQIIISSGCHPADFRTTCIGKSFLCRQNKGAVAFLGNVDVGKSSENTNPLIYTNDLYLSNIITLHRLGSLWLRTLKTGLSPQCRFHLLGDPTMVVWSDEPQSISPAASLSGNSIQISRSSSYSGQTWHVCAYKKGELYATDSLTNGNTLSFSISNIRTSGYVYLTYTGLNLKPYCDSIYINKGESTQLEISVQSIGNNPYNASDIALSPGDSVPITVNIHNNGNTMVNRMTIQFASDNPNINIGEGQKYHFYLDAGESFQETFGFRVKTDCPTSTIHDNNGIRLYVSITDDNNNHYYNECYVNVYKPEPIVTYMYYGGVSNQTNTYELKFQIANKSFHPLVGQSCQLTTTNPNVTITQGTANLGILEHGGNSDILAFMFSTNISFSFDGMMGLQLNLVVKGQSGWTETIPINGALRPSSLSSSAITLKPDADYMDIVITSNDTTKNYDIYRKIGNDYIRVNDYPVYPYFRDNNLTPQTTYYYKLKTKTAEGVEGSTFSDVVSATTLCAKADGFPKRLLGSKQYMGGLVSWDVNRDGKLEIFAKYKNWLEDKTSVVAIRANGENVFSNPDEYLIEDIDTKPSNSQNAPSIGELIDDGVMHVVASTYSDSTSYMNYISCYSMENVANENSPTLCWEKTGTNFNCPRSPVITDMDGDDISEVIIPAGGHIYIYNPQNDSLLTDIGRNIGHRTVAVASIIPNTTDKQIIFPVGGKMCVYNKANTSIDTLYQSAGKRLSSPVICDFDGDGVNEVIFGEWTDNSSASNTVYFKCAKYVPNANATILSLFSNSCRVGERKDCNISIGDVNNDGKPDIVSYGTSKIKVYDNETRTILVDHSITTHYDHINCVLIADINGDNFAEVIFPNYPLVDPLNGSEYPTEIKALNSNGQIVQDFNLQIDERAGEDMMIADIDGDGFSELVIGELCGQMSAWKTKGNPEKIEWGMVRGDAQNTGEYHKAVYPQLMQSGTVTTTNWNKDLYVTGNGVNASGTMNIADHKKVIVWENGVMNLSGATMNNAKVIVKDGGTMNLSNSSTVNLRNTKSFQVDKGGTLSITSGTIK